MIRIGRESQYLPYAGFFLFSLANIGLLNGLSQRQSERHKIWSMFLGYEFYSNYARHVWKEGFGYAVFQKQIIDTRFIYGLNQRQSEIHKSWFMYLGSFLIQAMPDMINMVCKKGWH